MPACNILLNLFVQTTMTVMNTHTPRRWAASKKEHYIIYIVGIELH